MKPRSTSVRTSSTRTRSPTSRPCSPRTTRPSTAGWRMRTQVPFGEAPVTIAVEALAECAGRAAGPPRTCAPAARPSPALSSCSGAVARQLASSCSARVGHGAPRERGLDEALRGEVREAAVGRGGVRVVLHREAEVAVAPSRRAAPPRTRPSPAASRPRATRRRSAAGSACAPAHEEAPGAPGRSAPRAAVSPRPAASSTMRSQRSGERSTRRSEGKPCRSRNCAVATLAAIMKSSIRSLAAVLLVRAQVGQHVAVEHRRATPVVSSVERAAVVAQLLHAPAPTRSCRRSCSATAGLRGDGRRRRPVPSSQAATES